MNRLAYLLSLICILAFSSCEEDKVYYHTAAKADFTIGENMYELGQTAVFKDASIPDEGSRIVAWLWEFGDAKNPSRRNRIQLSFIRRTVHLPLN